MFDANWIYGVGDCKQCTSKRKMNFEWENNENKWSEWKSKRWNDFKLHALAHADPIINLPVNDDGKARKVMNRIKVKW